jgi:hypothetical protein
MDLTDVYTLQPYANAQATTPLGPPQILSLSDLATDCPQTQLSNSAAITNTHPIADTFDRCNPRLIPPIEVKRLG